MTQAWWIPRQTEVGRVKKKSVYFTRSLLSINLADVMCSSKVWYIESCMYFLGLCVHFMSWLCLCTLCQKPFYRIRARCGKLLVCWSKFCIQTQSLKLCFPSLSMIRIPSCGALVCTQWAWPTAALVTTRPSDVCYMWLWVFPVWPSSQHIISLRGRQVYHAGWEAYANGLGCRAVAGIIIQISLLMFEK